MKLIGFKEISSNNILKIDDFDQIDTYNVNNIFYIKSDNLKLIDRCKKSSLKILSKANNIKELIVLYNKNVDIILVDEDFAKEAIDIATNYLFDSKIAVEVESLDDIDRFVKIGVDIAIHKDELV